MSRTNDQPKAIIHQNILDAAAEKPDASLKELSADVSGSTVDLVERVLKRYGDPTNQTPMYQNTTQSSEGEIDILEQELTDAQRETLRTIYENPEATQREIGSLLGISGPSVNRRLNSIPGFDWQQRETIATQIMHAEHTPNASTDRDQQPDIHNRDNVTSSSDPDEDGVDRNASAIQDGGTKYNGDLVAQLDAVENRLSTLETGNGANRYQNNTLDDVEFIHKVVHACMESDRITEEEELVLLQEILSDSTPTSESKGD